MLWSPEGAAFVSQTRCLCCVSLLEGVDCEHRGMRDLVVEYQSLAMDPSVFWGLQVFLIHMF